MLESSSAYSGKAHKPSPTSRHARDFFLFIFFICIFLKSSFSRVDSQTLEMLHPCKQYIFV